jgi:hypothetical protein
MKLLEGALFLLATVQTDCIDEMEKVWEHQ